MYKALMLKMQSLDTPIIRWGFVIVMFLVIWSVLLVPYLDWREQRIEMLHMQLSKVERLQALHASLHQWQKSEDMLSEASKELDGLFFQGSSYAVAQTDLLKVMHQYMRDDHLVLESQRLEDAEVDSELGEIIGVNLRFHGKLFDILSFVNALSKDQHLLSFSFLAISYLRENEALLQVKVRGYRLLALKSH